MVPFLVNSDYTYFYMYVQYFSKKVENFANNKLFTLINNISYLNADYIDYFCIDILIINLKIYGL